MRRLRSALIGLACPWLVAAPALAAPPSAPLALAGASSAQHASALPASASRPLTPAATAATSLLPKDIKVVNQDHVLHDVDRALGRAKPPGVEVIFVTPARSGKSVFSEHNPLGHFAVRYTMPSGEQRVMNIMGKSGKEMVNFLTPAEYLFDARAKGGSEQSSSLNRTMVSVRVEKVSPEQVVKLDSYFQDLKGRAERGEVIFDKGSPVLRNAIDKVVPGRQPEAGNCALWVTNGLVKAGLLDKPTQWPKKALLNVMSQAKAAGNDNVHVVAYEQVAAGNHGNHTHGLVTPLAWRKTMQYWNMDRRADAVVHLDPTTRREIVTRPLPLRSDLR